MIWKYFLLFVGYLFTLLTMSFEAHKFLILMKSNLFFSFVTCAFVISKNQLPNSMSRGFIPVGVCLFICLLLFRIFVVVFVCLFCFWLWHAVAWCGISVPIPGIEPWPRQWKHWVLTTRPPENPPFWINVCIPCEVGVQLYAFECGYPVVPEPFVEEPLFLSIRMSWHPFQKSTGKFPLWRSR